MAEPSKSLTLKEHSTSVALNLFSDTISRGIWQGGPTIVTWIIAHYFSLQGTSLKVIVGASVGVFILLTAMATVVQYWIMGRLSAKAIGQDKEIVPVKGVDNDAEQYQMRIRSLEAQVRRLQVRDETWSVQLGARNGEIETLNARLDEFKWLHEIAEQQARAIEDYVSLDCQIDSGHKLTGEDQYIDFIFSVTNRGVYRITLQDELSGHLTFGNRRLAKSPTLSGNAVKNLSLNDTRWFRINQSLTPDEAAKILSGGQFGLDNLQMKLSGSPNLTGSAPLRFGITGPSVSTEFIKNNYPKVEMKIEPFGLRSYFDHQEWAGPVLGTIVNLKLKLENHRVLKVRQFKLFTTGPVVEAIKGELHESPHIGKDGRPAFTGRTLSPNLADETIEVDRNNLVEGWLQFIVKGVDPPKMLNPSDFVVRLQIVDESGEIHQQDVVGLKYEP